MTKKDEVKELEAKNNIPEAEKKPFSKFGKQEKHIVEDVEYTFQFPGTRAAQAILETLPNWYGDINMTKTLRYKEDQIQTYVKSDKECDVLVFDRKAFADVLF